MHSLLPFATTALLLVRGLHAHFTVQHPPPIGEFKDEQEGTAPCGGYSPNLDDLTATDFHVDGDAIATTLTHPETTWLYRVTTDPTASSNWTEIWSIFKQSGAGAFCNPQVTVPHSFVGKKAILGIISHAVDGFLYQCSAVNFVAGTGTKPGDCKNASGVTSDFTDDPDLTSILQNPPATTSSPTRVPSAAISLKTGPFQNLSAMLTVGLMVIVGALLVG
ncbi:hypothetical protein AAE478_003993 [Parahypoxylon ruwenzoriense]